MAQAALRSERWMGGWKGRSKMLVSVLPAVNISMQTVTTAPAGSKGKCDLHIKCLLGGLSALALAASFSSNHVSCCFCYDLQRCIYVYFYA